MSHYQIPIVLYLKIICLQLISSLANIGVFKKLSLSQIENMSMQLPTQDFICIFYKLFLINKT